MTITDEMLNLYSYLVFPVKATDRDEMTQENLVGHMM